MIEKALILALVSAGLIAASHYVPVKRLFTEVTSVFPDSCQSQGWSDAACR